MLFRRVIDESLAALMTTDTTEMLDLMDRFKDVLVLLPGVLS
ncbi:hypothetical protein [Rathayibacter sp. VKM Ac-2835]|nr:hypothetical protein [Rathayibacter sp. VKM Ac-2835]